jgi:hypothetical protein
MYSPLSTDRPLIIAQQAAPSPQSDQAGIPLIWVSLTGILLLGIVGLGFYGKNKFDKHAKAMRLEKYKNKELQKKLKLALQTIKKMEANPDLVHSREFNLDYLRMRMDEEEFHYSIITQIKIKMKQFITVALRPNTGSVTTVGVANTSGRQIEEIFDITYETDRQGKRIKRILFRVQVKLTKLPTQSSSSTVAQIIECIEQFLNPSEDNENWQPSIQGRLAILRWDQKAKPTPLLVLEQSTEGSNVTIRSNPNRRMEDDMGSTGDLQGASMPNDRNPSPQGSRHNTQQRKGSSRSRSNQ